MNVGGEEGRKKDERSFTNGIPFNMSTVLQCENRLTGTYSFNDEPISRTPSPITSCSFYVDTALDR